MELLGFTQEELDAIRRACVMIHIGECTPPYLQDFIATRLADDFPELSTRVRQLDGAQMDQLCEHINGKRSAGP